MKERTWTIGSLPDCDIRVASPTVSGRHCRLTQRGQMFIVEDLASTNGTFVAGQRIDHPREVRRGEAITLGLDTPMPWPNLSSITVGRLPDNDVVIPLDMVSGRHARLEREGNRVFLIDLESRNGTALNDPLNKIARAPIQPSDVVFLGTHKIMARDLLAALPEDVPHLAAARQATKLEASPLADLGVKPPPTAPVTPPPPVSWLSSYRSPRSWALGIGLSAACILLVIGGSRIFRADSNGKSGVPNEPGAELPGAPRADTSVTYVDQPSGPKPTGSPAPKPPAPPPEFDEQLIRRSEKGVYLVCVRDGQTVGFFEPTAWAIAPDVIICPSRFLDQFEKVRVKGGKRDECIVVCSPAKTLRIDEHPPCGGDGAFLSIAHLDEREERALTVAADREAASSFNPRNEQPLAVIVAQGLAAGDQPDDPKKITTRLVRLTVDQVLLDDKKSPRGLYCTAAEDVGAAVPAPVFDGAGRLVGCVDWAKKTAVRVTLLRHLPALISAIP